MTFSRAANTGGALFGTTSAGSGALIPWDFVRANVCLAFLRIDEDLLSPFYNLENRRFALARPVDTDTEINLVWPRVIAVLRN